MKRRYFSNFIYLFAAIFAFVIFFFPQEVVFGQYDSTYDSGYCMNQGSGPCGTVWQQSNCCSGLICRPGGNHGSVCGPPNTPTPTRTPTPTPIPRYDISGRVFNDDNNNGNQNSGESGMQGVTVSIPGVGSRTTSSTGFYSFSNVLQGSYTVSMTLPSGYYDTTTNPRSVNLNNNTTVNFGLTNQDVFVVSGKVFRDANGNGVQNCSGSCNNGSGDELNLENITVTLSGEANVTTDSNGNFSFTGVSGGSHVLTVPLPEGYYDTTTNPRNITVGPNVSGQNFGIIDEDIFTISGTVFDDNNGDGNQDCSGSCNNGSGDERNYSGATITLSGAASASTTSNSSGDYSFTNLPGGSFTVTLELPSGYYPTSTNPINTTLGPSRTGLDFGITNDAEFEISGSVFIDSDGDGNQDCNFTCNNGSGDELNYSGAVISVVGTSSGSDTTNSSGDYSVDDLFPGTYTVTISNIPGYAAANNPAQITIPPDGTVNFALTLVPSPPTCAGVTPGASTVAAGDSTTISASGCSPNPTYAWPSPETVPPGGSAGSNSGGNQSTTTYTAPENVCEDATVRQTVDVSNAGGSNSYSVDITISPENVLSGSVFIDTAGNNCASGTTPYASGATVNVYDSGGNLTGSDTSDGAGAYLVSDTSTCGDKTAVLSIPDYRVTQVRVDGGAWSNANLAAYTYGPFDFSADHTLDWCVSDAVPWFQVGDGDIRWNNLVNDMPFGEYTSTGTEPAICYSSNFTADFGGGACSENGGTVNDEYSYNDESKTANGLFSYSFFLSRARVKNVSISTLPGCGESGTCTTGISNLSTGVYRVNGDLNLTSYSHQSGEHVTILVNGDLNIQDNILIPAGAGNLGIFAAKGNIVIESEVGEEDSASTDHNIEGIFTAEGGIIFDGDGCEDSVTPDRKLNMAGNFVANALKPFETGGSGTIQNRRSLCTDDLTYPVFTVDYRPDFITQLTDFYKVPWTRWRELAP